MEAVREDNAGLGAGPGNLRFSFMTTSRLGTSTRARQ
jgi:hypothetical protein